MMSPATPTRNTIVLTIVGLGVFTGSSHGWMAGFGDGPVLVVKDGVLVGVSAQDPLARSSAAQFDVIDHGLGRVALQSAGGFLSVSAPGHKGQVTLKSGEPVAPANKG
jgi:hypothetical protein